MTKIHFRPYIPNQTVLFPQRIDEDIAKNDPVRMVNALVESLNLEGFRKLYKECGRSPYHPRMMLKVILYAYMNNIYSCRKIEKLLHRDTERRLNPRPTSILSCGERPSSGTVSA